MYWTRELTESQKNRKLLYERYRRIKSARNLILWKKLRAEHGSCMLRDTKRKHWIKLADSFSTRTAKAKIYENIRKIQGQSERKINILRDGDHTLLTVPEIANLLSKTFMQ